MKDGFDIQSIDRNKLRRLPIAGDNSNTPLGTEVFRWPEFQAFAQRLGMALSLPIVAITIEIPLDDPVKVYMSHYADNLPQCSNKPVDK